MCTCLMCGAGELHEAAAGGGEEAALPLGHAGWTGAAQEGPAASEVQVSSWLCECVQRGAKCFTKQALFCQAEDVYVQAFSCCLA